MIRFGVIGCGNMGGAMLRQLLSKKIVSPDEVYVSDKDPEVRERLRKEWNITAEDNNRKAASAPCVLLAVKPQFMPQVSEDLSAALPRYPLILSIVAGYDLQMLYKATGRDQAHIVRIMPNTPAMVGEGVLAACRGQYVTDAEWTFAGKMLGCMGMFQEVPERLMDAVTGVSGSSPAFVFLFLEALADAGVRGGMPRDMAQRFAAQTLIGAGKLALETGKHPGQLKDMVTSPAGTTIEGVAALEKNGFRYAVMEAVEAAIEKSRSFHQN